MISVYPIALMTMRGIISSLAICLGLVASGLAHAATLPLNGFTLEHIEPTRMTGRWYEVARLPNKIQKDCQGGTSDWVRTGEGFQVLQSCHRGSLLAPATEWHARAKILDPKTNARIKMSFFGGVVNLEYWVLEHKADQGWLILATPDGKYLWLMSQRPTLASGVKAQAVAQIRQFGFDVSRLEFPPGLKN